MEHQIKFIEELSILSVMISFHYKLNVNREQSSQELTDNVSCEPEVNLLRGVDGAGCRQGHERVDGKEESLLLVRLQDEDGEPQEQRRRVQVPLARVRGGRRVGQEGVAEGLSCG